MKSACSAIDAVVDGMGEEDANLYRDKLAPLIIAAIVQTP
jgi:hypothetical protein